MIPCTYCGIDIEPPYELRDRKPVCDPCADLIDTVEALPVHTGSRIRALRTILRDHQAGKIDGFLVDVVTASMLVTIYDALKPENRMKFGQIPLPRLVDFGWKHVT